MKTYKRYLKRLMFCAMLVGGAACGAIVAKPNPTAESPVTPSATIASSPSASASATPAQKPTYAVYPTLTNQLQDQFYVLLSTNGNCELPCLWGIMPGQTSWADADTLLERFAMNKPLRFDATRATPHSRKYGASIETNKDIGLLLYLALDVDPGSSVSTIVLQAMISRNGRAALDDTHLSRYSLREVFRRHGPPDNVYMLPVRRGVYAIYVVYERVKLAIGFSGSPKEKANGGYTLCPNLGDGNIGSMILAVASPTGTVDVKTLMGYPFWDVPPFKETTGMSIDDFYQLMVGEQEPACFDVK